MYKESVAAPVPYDSSIAVIRNRGRNRFLVHDSSSPRQYPKTERLFQCTASAGKGVLLFGTEFPFYNSALLGLTLLFYGAIINL